MRKWPVVLALVGLLLPASIASAARRDPNISSTWTFPEYGPDGLPIAGDRGSHYVSWWVDENRVLHEDWSGRDPDEPGAHTIVRSSLDGSFEEPTDAILIAHNVSTARAVGQTCIYSGPVNPGDMEIYTIDGLPLWRWIDATPEAKKEMELPEFCIPTDEHRFYDAVKAAPGEKKLELWFFLPAPAGRAGNPIAALHTYETVTPYYLDVWPFKVNGEPYVPVRGVLDRLGADVTWDADRQVARVSANGRVLTIRPADGAIYLEGQPAPLPEKAVLVNGRSTIPLKLIPNLGYSLTSQKDGEFAEQFVITAK